MDKGRDVGYIWKITREFAKCVITVFYSLIIRNSTTASSIWGSVALRFAVCA